MARLHTLTAVGALCALSTAAQPSGGLSVDVNVDTSTGAYSIILGGKTWFSSSAYVVTYDGATRSSASGSLTISSSAPVSGSDVIGAYSGTAISWNGGVYTTTFKVYPSASAIVFEQGFPAGLNRTSLGAKSFNDLSTVFPSVQLADTPQDSGLAYLAWAHCMCGGHVGQWSAQTSPDAFGREGGVIAIYNQSLASVAISAANNFMVGALAFPSSVSPKAFGAGLMGTVNPIPAGFVHRTLMVAAQGVNASMYAWGDVLLRLGGKTRTAPNADLIVSTLSAWTDNGAYYYYSVGGANISYQQAMLDVKQYWDSQDLPLQYMQADSWWYFKDGAPGNSTFPFRGGALWLWEPIPEVFPSGFTQWLGLPWALHNRYFGAENAYSGQFTFLTEPTSNLALPIDVNLFKYIMSRAQNMGMVLYEQDWLITTYEGMNVTQSNVTAAHDWLMAMSNAAAALNVTIQYCMPLPNHMLHSTLSQPVTNARASGDYHAGTDQWDIGLSSLFYWSIGIAPSKDDWWTTEVQPGNPYSDNPTEPNWQLQAIVISLSTGPNGPSDMINGTNVTLVMSTVRGDGLNLQPDRPATVMDAALAGVFSSSQVVPDVWSTWTAMGPYRWNFVLAVRLADTFTLHLSDLESPDVVTSFAVFDYFNAQAGPVATLDAAHSFDIAVGQGQPSAPSAAQSLRYYICAPVLPSGWVLYGEVGKIVTMSHQRTASVTLTADGFNAIILGAANGRNEASGVTFLAFSPTGTRVTTTCPPQSQSTLKCSTSVGGCTCA